MELTAGGTLGRYRLLERAGAGGMAEVWRAVQPGLDRIVAVKVLPRHLATDPDFLERFRREARAISRLDHQNILGIYDFGEDDGYTYMVMPFLGGGTLSRNLGQPWSVQAAVRVLEPLASALDYAHARGIIHRDVKPSNVLIGEGGRVVLADFGIARMTEGTMVLTAAGALAGTPAYMSPEQVQGGVASPASDQYSLAVMAYQMVTGRRPFEAETPLAVALAHVHRPLPPPRSLNPAIPPDAERVLFKALAKQPEDRYRTVSAFVAALTAASQQAPPAGHEDAWRQVGPAPPSPAAVPPWPAPAAPSPAPWPASPGRPASERPTPFTPGASGGGPAPHDPARPTPAPSHSPSYLAPGPTPSDPTQAPRRGPSPNLIVGVVVAVAIVASALLFWAASDRSETASSTPAPVAATSTPGQAASTSSPTAVQSSPVARPVSPVVAKPSTAAAKPSPAAVQSSPSTRPSPATASPKPSGSPAPGSVLVSDNFESAARGAFQPSYNLAGVGDGSYADGELRVRRITAGGGYAIPVPYTPEHDDATLAVDIRLVSANPSRILYVSCRRKSGEPNTGYRLELDPVRGQFRIARWTTTNEAVLVPWRESGAIRRNDETNRLELSCVGTTIEASANGQSLAKIEDGTLRQGYFNLGVIQSEGEPPAEARFDNLTVTRR